MMSEKSYRELQALAKKHNIPANLKKSALASKLDKLLDKENALSDNRPKMVKLASKMKMALASKSTNIKAVAKGSKQTKKSSNKETRSAIVTRKKAPKKTEETNIDFDWDMEKLTSKPSRTHYEFTYDAKGNMTGKVLLDHFEGAEANTDRTAEQEDTDEEINAPVDRMTMPTPSPKRTLTDARSRSTGFLPLSAVSCNVRTPGKGGYIHFD